MKSKSLEIQHGFHKIIQSDLFLVKPNSGQTTQRISVPDMQLNIIFLPMLVVRHYFSSFAVLQRFKKKIISFVLFASASTPFYNDMLFTTLSHVQRSSEH